FINTLHTINTLWIAVYKDCEQPCFVYPLGKHPNFNKISDQIEFSRFPQRTRLLPTGPEVIPSSTTPTTDLRPFHSQRTLLKKLVLSKFLTVSQAL
ncbi:MAG TPA: hypothetical protein PKH51_09850, partial [Candidatus Sumerlaeota bacterium]|nr:hypothetical protein [Candidatus Sumerlaeota bacterium]